MVSEVHRVCSAGPGSAAQEGLLPLSSRDQQRPVHGLRNLASTRLRPRRDADADSAQAAANHRRHQVLGGRRCRDTIAGVRAMNTFEPLPYDGKVWDNYRVGGNMTIDEA